MSDIYKNHGNYGVRTSSGVMKLGKKGTLNPKGLQSKMPEWIFQELDHKRKYEREEDEKRGTLMGDDLYGREHHNGVSNMYSHFIGRSL